MTNVKICDGCGERITGRLCVSVQVYLQWDDVELLDFHAEKGCLRKLAEIVKKLTKEVRI